MYGRRIRAALPLAGIVAAAVLLVALIALNFWPGRSLPMRLEAHSLSSTEFAFEPQRLTAPARVHVSLTFANLTTAPHTLVVLPPMSVSSGVIVEPGRTDRVDFTTPGPGVYRFVCNVHEGMGGLLVIE